LPRLWVLCAVPGLAAAAELPRLLDVSLQVSGNSTEPHLHFQLMNRNSPLGSEGLPYALAEYTIAKRVTGGFDAGLDAVKLAAPEKHNREMPLEMQLVNFN